MEICSVIKNIRLELALSQVAFAEKMHVHFSTVNRWENGHAQPNPLATASLIDLCEKEAVDRKLINALRVFEKTRS